MLNCLAAVDSSYFFNNKDSKFDSQNILIKKFNNNFIPPSYFPAWLSGFMEAESHFAIYTVNDIMKPKKPKSFCIGQNYDLFIIKAIQTYLKSHNKIIQDKKTINNVPHFRIYIYGKDVREILYHHFLSYPLLGYKNSQYQNWISLDERFKN